MGRRATFRPKEEAVALKDSRMSEPLYTVYSADSSFVPLPVSATNRDNDGHNSGLRLEGAVPFLSVKLMKISCFLLDAEGFASLPRATGGHSVSSSLEMVRLCGLHESRVLGH